ncbi:hypothetical protein HMN09_00865800 [Mycena chlorophos]|uniref:Uncharacterized protein n=1 Tax=Mycena chlorophos TaxID=658473 RepID=A0A8H6SQ38_MYCCL|nr:hypothetical protein HMN09_00865800 [Mycena chlorophos]
MSSSSPVLRMPPELLERIAEYIAEDIYDGRRRLGKLSLTHSIFRQPSQRFLFRVLKLACITDYDNDDHFSPKTARAFLDSDPRLPNFITHLSLDIGNSKEEVVSPAQIEAVQAVLAKIPILRHVAIRAAGLTLRNSDRETAVQRLYMVRDLLAKHRGQLRSLTVTYLTAAPVSVVHAFFSAAPCLKLQRVFDEMPNPVAGTELDDMDAPGKELEPPPSSLEVLDFDFYSSKHVTNLLKTPAFTPYIRRLREIPYHGNASDVFLAGTATSTIERIVADFTSRTVFMGLLAFNLALPASMPNLREIEFQVTSLPDALQALAGNDRANTFYSTLFSCPRLEKVTIKIMWSAGTEMWDLRPLEVVASQLERYISVSGHGGRRVRCEWMFQPVGYPAASPSRTVEEAVKSQMPVTIRRGLFKWACYQYDDIFFGVFNSKM